MEQVLTLHKSKIPLNELSTSSEPPTKQGLNKISFKHSPSLHRSLSQKNLRFPNWISQKIKWEIEEEFMEEQTPQFPQGGNIILNNQAQLINEESDSESESEESCCSFYEEILTGPVQMEYSETPSIFLNNSLNSGDHSPNGSLVESFGCSSSSEECMGYKKKIGCERFKDEGMVKNGIRVFRNVIIENIEEALWESRSCFSGYQYNSFVESIQR